MKRIVVKEIDKLKSTMNGDKVITEYLIYLILNQGGDDIKLNGFTEYGEANKNARINGLIVEHFTNNESIVEINKKDIIQEVTFEEYLNN
jgi:hypothetical protein